MTHSCWHCSGPIPPNQFHRQDSCDKCGRDTHACKNCEHYDPTFNNQCKESSADRVVEKEKSNFCDYFKPGARAGGSAKGAADLKSAADALFKKSPTPTSDSNSAGGITTAVDPAKAAAEALFKKK